MIIGKESVGIGDLVNIKMGEWDAGWFENKIGIVKAVEESGVRMIVDNKEYLIVYGNLEILNKSGR